MNCREVQQSISAWIDGELADEDRIALEAHLGGCSDCRSLAEQMRLDDAVLLRALAPCRRASERVATGVIARQMEKGRSFDAKGVAPGSRGGETPVNRRREAAGTYPEADASGSPGEADASGSPAHDGQTRASSAATDSPRSTPLLWLFVPVAAAAGFLLAVLLFRPWQRPQERIVQVDPAARWPRSSTDASAERVRLGASLRSDPSHPAPAVPPAVARLTVATGDVHWQRPSEQSWRAITADAAIVPGSRLRTEENVRCELETKEGGVVRLDTGTQVKFLSEDKLELAQGQIACTAPPDGQFEIVASEVSGGLSPGQAALWSCPTSEPTAVTCSTGSLELSLGEDRHVIEHGETVRLLNGKLVKAENRQDPVLVTSWIHSLLVLKGHGNEELRQRVNHLLAGIGRAKLSYLYEQEIRTLGEYGAVPLLEYVRSDESREEPIRRRKAMRIVADLAPPGAVGQLVDLLPDGDPQVRFQAARGLERLTGQTFGRAPEQWRDEDAESAGPALAAWRKYLESRRHSNQMGTGPPELVPQAPLKSKARSPESGTTFRRR